MSYNTRLIRASQRDFSALSAGSPDRLPIVKSDVMQLLTLRYGKNVLHCGLNTQQVRDHGDTDTSLPKHAGIHMLCTRTIRADLGEDQRFKHASD